MEVYRYFFSSSLQTQIFVYVSVFVLSILFTISFQRKLMITKAAIYLGVNILFALLLSKISTYGFKVHVNLYIVPATVLSLIMLALLKTVSKGQEEEKRKAEKGKYSWELKTDHGKIKIENPFEGVGIFAGSGSGKTKSIVKPIIQEMAKKDFAGIIYDFKRFELTRCAYTYYLEKNKVTVRMANFFDLRYSERFNTIPPEEIKSTSYAHEAAFVVMNNLRGRSDTRGSDPYWIETPTGILASVIWRLKEDFPEYCDFPHAAGICLGKSNEELIRFIKGNQQSEMMGQGFIRSMDNEKLSGSLMSVLANDLSKVITPEVFWVLSGNDFSLDLNNEGNPQLLCLSTTMETSKVHAPVISLVVAMAIKKMGEKRKHHANILLDESPTLKIPDFDNIPATMREYMIASTVIMQDMVQGEKGYGRIDRDSILSNLATQFYGRVRDPETAERYAKMFGRVFQEMKSRNRKYMAAAPNSFNYSQREVYRYKPEKFLHLSPGEFYGIFGTGKLKEFEGKFTMYNGQEMDIPVISDVTEREVKDNFERILVECKNIG